MNFMRGYLTYTLAIIMLVAAPVSFYLKVIDLETALGMVWAGLAVFGIRRAVD